MFASTLRGLLASSLALALCTATLTTAGCAVDGGDDVAAVAGGVEVTVTTAHGTQAATLGGDDVAAIEALLPGFVADGAATDDLTRVLTASTLEVRAADGSLRRWVRDGGALRSVENPERSLAWDAARGVLTVSGASRDVDVALRGDAETTQRAAALLVRLGVGDHAASLADELAGQPSITGGEVIVTVVVVVFASWALCVTVGNAYCAMAAVAMCGEGQVKSFKMNCGINVGDLGSTDAVVSGMGAMGSCDVLCKGGGEPPGDPPSGPGLPPTFEPVPLPVAVPMGCPEGTHPDICIVGWQDSSVWDADTNELVITTEPISEPCCAPDGASDAP